MVEVGREEVGQEENPPSETEEEQSSAQSALRNLPRDEKLRLSCKTGESVWCREKKRVDGQSKGQI